MHRVGSVGTVELASLHVQLFAGRVVHYFMPNSLEAYMQDIRDSTL